MSISQILVIFLNGILFLLNFGKAFSGTILPETKHQNAAEQSGAVGTQLRTMLLSPETQLQQQQQQQQETSPVAFHSAPPVAQNPSGWHLQAPPVPTSQDVQAYHYEDVSTHMTKVGTDLGNDGDLKPATYVSSSFHIYMLPFRGA